MTVDEHTDMLPEHPNARIRTHLANERTFLAWIRTGLTFIALGLASAQLLESRVVAGIPLTRLLGALLVILGGVIAIVGRWRFRQTAISIRSGDFRPRREGLNVVVLGVAVVTIISLVLVWNLRSR